ncbi:hypothetical protein SAMN04515672_0122 [Natronorubrum texcoconense]|uniref:Uncharacterized protein n=2 Tax=Natronorubrum texcoconense TaxID=1095776 RepID=A0A1G9H6K5_9EURY|nr:hypothetical protein SAMN04515672_0122 [Natronorubrum texcoconense]
MRELGYLRPTLLLEYDDIGFEQDIEVSTNHANVTVKLAGEIANRGYFVGCDCLEEPFAFWSQNTFGSFAPNHVHVIEVRGGKGTDKSHWRLARVF